MAKVFGEKSFIRVIATDTNSNEVSPGVFENQILINKVQQTLTNNSGTNTGQDFSLVAGLANTVRINRIQQSANSVTSNVEHQDIFPSSLLTDQERSNLYDYLVAEGQIP